MKPKVLSYEDIVDIVGDAISDSMDIDWTPVQGARSVVRELRRHNLLRGQDLPDPVMDAMLNDVFVAALRRAGV